MKILVSERLSEHKYKTPEGYLICTDAVLARTGKQTYTKDEVFGDGDSTEIDVDRPYEQVMNEKTIASFENKPVTFDHPDEDVNVGNYKSYAVGYVRDVHQGKSDGQDVILGNLVITDQDAIDAIESGEHTDLSCGYECDIKDDGNGHYAQNNIRGNHVALCKEGRAGNARIVDSVNDAKHDFSWFRGYINANLQNYSINSLISNVKSKKQFLHTNLAGNDGNVYIVIIDGSLDADFDKGSDMWIDIIQEKPDGKQKRVMTYEFNSWNECQQIFNSFKRRVRDSIDDAMKPSVKDVAREIFEALVDEGFSAKKVQDMIKKKDSSVWDKLARHGHTKFFDDDDEVDKFCKTNKAQLFKELDNLFEREAELAFDDDELEEIGFFDSKQTTLDDALKILSIVDAYKKVKDEYLGMVYISGRPMYIIHKKEPGIPEFWGITPSKWGDNPRKKFKSKKELDNYLTSVNAVTY